MTCDPRPRSPEAETLPSPGWAYREYRLAMKAGNEAFCHGAHRDAEAPYATALRIAERLFQRTLQNGYEAGTAVAAVVDARHNIAANLMRQGRCDEALMHLRAAANTICQGLLSSEARDEFRDACERELMRAVEAVAHHLQRMGAPPEQVAAAQTAIAHRQTRSDSESADPASPSPR